jgi:tetratricopeptide (TPR) repeat protein
MLEQMGRMEIKSKELLNQINYLGEAVVKLSPKERALFKKPQVEIGDNEIALSAPKQENVQEAPALPTTQDAAATTPPAAVAENAKAENAEPASANSPKEAPVASATAPKPATPPLPTDGAAADRKATTQPVQPVENAGNPREKVTKSESSSSGVDPSGLASISADLQPVAQEAKDQFERGNYREAEKGYEKILAKSPSNLYALSNLGVVRFRSGKLKLAEDAFRKAISIAPEDAFSHCTLGIIFYSQSRYDDAVNELTKSLAINPKYAAAHNFLGITASQKGWQEAAQKELETATALDPNYADAHFNLAVVLATQQNQDKDNAKQIKENARHYYKRATELGAEPDRSLEQLLQ